MLVLNIIFLLLSQLIENSRETHFLIETEDGNGGKLDFRQQNKLS